MSLIVEKRWNEERLKKDRLLAIQAHMKEQNISGLYLNDGYYIRYVLNLKVPGAGVFVPIDGDAIIFVRPRDAGYVKLRHQNVRPEIFHHNDIRDGTNPDEAGHFAKHIVELLSEHGVSGGALGVDDLSASAVLALAREGVDIVEAAPLIERTWSIKTEDEVSIYRLIGQQYAHTMMCFRDALRPGITENQLSGVVTNAWYEAGGENIAQLNVCSGENMNPWRRWPTDRALVAGEFVGIDLHGRGLAGLRGDCSRTFFVGDDPSPKQDEIYRRAYGFLQESIGNFRAGRTFQEVVDSIKTLVPDEFRIQQFNLNVGHGASLGSSGYPHIDPKKEKQADDVLRPNQLIAAECFFGEVGSAVAVKLEEMVIVQEGTPEALEGIPYDEHFVTP